MKKILFSLVMLVMTATAAWADVIPATKADVGKVLCSDGSIYATVSDAAAASKTAQAMIAYVDDEKGTALGIALEDAPIADIEAGRIRAQHADVVIVPAQLCDQQLHSRCNSVQIR